MSETPEQPSPSTPEEMTAPHETPAPGGPSAFEQPAGSQPPLAEGPAPAAPDMALSSPLQPVSWWKTHGPRLGRISAWTALWLLIAAYCAAIGAYVVFDHEAFRTQAFDLGIFDQGLWLVSRGHVPFITLRGLHRFGDHIEFILYLLAPAYWVWDDVRCALLLQTIVIAMGALPVFLLARKKLGQAVALCFAFVYLISPSVQNLNLDHVHAEAFGATALLFAFYFASERRFAGMFACCGLAMLCKEDVAVTTAVFGLLVAWRWNWKAGIALFLVSALWFVLCMKVFLPAFNDVGFFRFKSGWFSGWNSNRWNLDWYWRAFVHDPGSRSQNYWPAGRYLLHLLGPLAFLPLLSPATALVALPAIVINLLTTTDYMRSLNYHYMTSITPFLFAAAIEGAELIAGRAHRPFAYPFVKMRREENLVLFSPGIRILGPVVPKWAWLLLVAPALLYAGWRGNDKLSHIPLRRTVSKIREAYNSSNGAEAVATRAAISRVPADAVVSADYLTVPHLAHRTNVYMFPNPFWGESWGTHDENQHDPNIIQYILVKDGTLDQRKRTLIANLLKKGEFETEYVGGGVRLYKRVASAREAVIARPSEGNGLVGVFYSFENSLSEIPEPRRRDPVFQATFPTIDFPPTNGPLESAQGIQTGMTRRFLAVFEGFLKVPEDGEYVFSVWSDDGFRLFLGERQVSECNRLHAFDETRGSVRLTRGLTPIKLLYFDNEPSHGLRLEWRTPGAPDTQLILPQFLYPTKEAAGEK